MDGTQDRPGGKTAENWSRKDRIRGGAVTGPWRSAPRVEEGSAVPQAPVEDFPQAPRPQLPRDGRHLYAVDSSHAAQDHPATAAHPSRGKPTSSNRHLIPEPKKRGPAGMIAWVAFGVIFAAGCVIIAFLFQPEPPAPGMTPTIDVLGNPNGPAEEPVAPAGKTAAAAVSPAALAGIASVRIRVGPDFPADRRDGIVATLGQVGLHEVQVEALPFPVSTSRVGYYRPGDQRSAEALAEAIGLALGERVGVRDYGQLSPPPEAGRLDLWLGN